MYNFYCGVTFSSMRPYRYVRVSEARYSTILKTPVNPLNCF
ncbi:hypothetical protein DENIT_11112 [Pseudomonas veronii]|nr:hypothetical protein DENIT_11112 [Pseudomonas veronii]